MTHFEEIGGEPRLRVIIDAFVDAMFDDAMIGFFFSKVSRERIKKFEYQHAAQFLGADLEYEGRPLAVAHRAHRIMGGQFLRRKEILRKNLVEHEVPAHIIDAWLAHVESLRPLITSDPAGECIEH